MSADERKDLIIKILKNGPTRGKDFRKNGVALDYLYEMEKDGEIRKVKEGCRTFWML